MTDFDTLMRESARWVNFVFSVAISAFGLGFVYIHGKVSGRTGKFRMRAYRCVAATVRYPNRAFILSWAIIGISFMFVAIARWNDVEAGPEVRFMATMGLAMAMGSTVGIAMWRALVSHTHQPAVLEFQTERPVGESGIGPVIALDNPTEFVSTGSRVVFTGRHLNTVEG